MGETEKPRLSRLTTILTQLQSKKIVTAKYLSEKHNVSVRTIYRDIRTLENSGIPIITEEGKGYSIMEGYHLPPVLFTEDEANALITIEQLVHNNKDQSLIDNISSALEKIKSILKYAQKGNVDLLADRIYFGGNKNEEKTSNNLMQIQSAIIHFKVCSFITITITAGITSSLAIARITSITWISLVPSYKVIIWASRNIRSASNSFE